MPHTQPCGKKRKLCSLDDCVLEKSSWQKRKPAHLTITHGFLPADTLYKRQKMQDGTTFIVGEKKRKGHFSKFHSVLQIVLAAIYRKTRFVAAPVAITATTSLSSTHDSIFDLDESEFIFEYYRKDKLKQTLPMVEQGIVLQVGLTKQLVKKSKLLQRVHAFLKHYKVLLCPSKRPLLSIRECFEHLTKFRLHFDSLYLLPNAEETCLRNEHRPSNNLHNRSAFDLLYDVWVCCYLPMQRSYTLRYLPTRAWDYYRKGQELCLVEFSEEIDTSAKLKELSYWASKAASHYNFFGYDFVVSENSLLYQEFMRNCIKA